MPGLHQRDGLQPNRRDVARSWAKNRADTGGADILIQVEEELQSQGTTLALARVHPPVLALWERAGVVAAVGESNVFDSVRDAVHALSDHRPKAQR